MSPPTTAPSGLDLDAIAAASRGFSETRFEAHKYEDSYGIWAVTDGGMETPLDDALDEHVAAPIALLLNSVAPLVAEVRRLRAGDATASATRAALYAAHLALGACSCPHPHHRDEDGPTCSDGCAAALVVRALGQLINEEQSNGGAR